MDGTAAINHNLEALKRILTGLVAMAGLVAGRHPEVRAEGEPRRTLPRHLHRAILRLLRPAESAARRLIIAAARGLVESLPPPRKPRQKPASVEPILRRFGIAVVMSSVNLVEAAKARRAAAIRAPRSHRLTLPLFDPPRRVPVLSKRRRPVPVHAAPRILFPGAALPSSLPQPPGPASPDDPIDATRLNLRLAALAAALDDLPGQAKRFARWKARGAARDAQEGRASGRIRRVSPLRSGRPPGGRLSRFDPCARRSSSIREVDEVLAHAHALALYALRYPDTS